MRFDPAILRAMLRPAWVALIIGSTLLAGLAALWVGLQQDAGETSTTFVFGRRVGYLDRPIPVLDDHLNEIINSVEFPIVFQRIEERLLLEENRDYDLTIGVAEDTQSIVEIKVRTDRVGDADRIARIIAEEMVEFVLEEQDLTVATEIADFDARLADLRDDQERIVALAGGVPPTQAERILQGELLAIEDSGETGAVVTNRSGQIREQLGVIRPLATDYNRNASTIRGLERERAQVAAQRLDITSSQEAINDEWYRLITPVEKSSNVPVAVAMGFAAAVPAALVATTLAFLNVARRVRAMRIREREEAEERSRVRSSVLRV